MMAEKSITIIHEKYFYVVNFRYCWISIITKRRKLKNVPNIFKNQVQCLEKKSYYGNTNIHRVINLQSTVFNMDRVFSTKFVHVQHNQKNTALLGLS